MHEVAASNRFVDQFELARVTENRLGDERPAGGQQLCTFLGRGTRGVVGMRRLITRPALSGDHVGIHKRQVRDRLQHESHIRRLSGTVRSGDEVKGGHALLGCVTDGWAAGRVAAAAQNDGSLLVGFGPRAAGAGELSSEVQVGQARSHLLIPARPHQRLAAFVQVIVMSLAREHALDITLTCSRRGFELASDPRPVADLLCGAAAGDRADRLRGFGRGPPSPAPGVLVLRLHGIADLVEPVLPDRVDRGVIVESGVRADEPEARGILVLSIDDPLPLHQPSIPMP